MIRWLILFPFFLGLAFVLSHEFLYESFVVPRLSGWKEVPILWSVVTLAPEAAVCVAAALNEPGYLKMIEGDPLHFVMQFLVLSVLLLGIVATIRTFRFAVLRLPAANRSILECRP